MLKRTTQLKKNSGLKKGSSKLKTRPKTKEAIQENKEAIEKMHKLFNEIWQEKDKGGYRECESCGWKLYGENSTMYHHHMLPKNKYPEFKYYKENLILLCSTCHNKCEIGYPSDIVIERTKIAKELWKQQIQ